MTINDGWQPFDVELPVSNGNPSVITLVTDSNGAYNYDWTCWVDPTIVFANN